MLNWLKGWLGLGRTAPAAPKPVAAAAARAPVPEAVQQFGLRRPLVGRAGRVAGFELQLPAAALRRIQTQGAAAASAAHHAALLVAASALAASGRSALVSLPAELLEKHGVASAVGAGVMLLVDDALAVPPEVAAALRGRGAMIGVRDRPPSAAPPVDFVMLQASAGALDLLLLSAQRWREVLPRVVLLGQGFTRLDEMEKALRGGLSLAGGPLSRGEVPQLRRELGSAAHRICELLNHLALDRDTAVIADAVRGDVALTYRLLRYANSPAIGLRRVVESVDDAVTLLGRSELYRWLSVQLMAAAEMRQASRALEEAALARGRVLELVAQARGDEQPGAHFTLGLLSLIEQLLQTPMAQALAPLRLSDAAREALLERRGPWAPRLALLDAAEAGQGEEFSALAVGLGLDEDRLSACVEEAWRWAAAVREGAA